MTMQHLPILLVEDNQNDVLLIRRAFAKAQLTNPLQVVQHGDAAIDYLLGSSPYDDRTRYPLPVVVLLDLKLPRCSGFEVLAWLRHQPELRRLPVIVLTSSQEAEDINRAYDEGANSYLVKPVTFDALLGLVKSLELYWVLLNEQPQILHE